MDNNDYTALQLDTIKEFANVGGGNAATSISQMIDKPVNMSVPTIEIMNYVQVFEQIMPEDEKVIAVSMRMFGEAKGNFLFVCSEEKSMDLIKMMVSKSIEINEEIGYSAIKELTNILVTSYLNAISRMINVNLISSIPALAKDMFGAILSSAYIETDQYDENIMIIKNEFIQDGDKIESSLYFIPKPGVLSSLFKIIGI
ncbi:MAG: chemotaxis protein CheC [Eubacteriaceae bacterium]